MKATKERFLFSLLLFTLLTIPSNLFALDLKELPEAGIKIESIKVDRLNWGQVKITPTYSHSYVMAGMGAANAIIEEVYILDANNKLLYHGPNSRYLTFPDDKVGSEEDILIRFCADNGSGKVCREKKIKSSPKQFSMTPDFEYPLDNFMFKGRYDLNLMLFRPNFESPNQLEKTIIDLPINGEIEMKIGGSEIILNIPINYTRGDFDLNRIEGYQDFRKIAQQKIYTGDWDVNFIVSAMCKKIAISNSEVKPFSTEIVNGIEKEYVIAKTEKPAPAVLEPTTPLKEEILPANQQEEHTSYPKIEISGELFDLLKPNYLQVLTFKETALASQPSNIPTPDSKPLPQASVTVEVVEEALTFQPIKVSVNESLLANLSSPSKKLKDFAVSMKPAYDKQQEDLILAQKQAEEKAIAEAEAARLAAKKQAEEKARILALQEAEELAKAQALVEAQTFKVVQIPTSESLLLTLSSPAAQLKDFAASMKPAYDKQQANLILAERQAKEKALAQKRAVEKQNREAEATVLAAKKQAEKKALAEEKAMALAAKKQAEALVLQEAEELAKAQAIVEAQTFKVVQIPISESLLFMLASPAAHLKAFALSMKPAYDKQTEEKILAEKENKSPKAIVVVNNTKVDSPSTNKKTEKQNNHLQLSQELSLSAIPHIIGLVHNDPISRQEREVTSWTYDELANRFTINMIVRWQDRWTQELYEVGGTLKMNQDGSQADFKIDSKNKQVEMFEILNNRKVQTGFKGLNL